MPQKLCTWHSAKGSRAGQCSTTLLQLHRAHFCSTIAPGKLAGTLCWVPLHTAWRHAQKLSRTSSWEGKAPRKPTGLQEYHTFKTNTRCPRFHNEFLAPPEQLCLKGFSTTCHHWQRFAFDLKLLRSLGRNFRMQNPAAEFAGWFSFLTYKCPHSPETAPACPRDWLCLFSSQCCECLHCQKQWWQAVGQLLLLLLTRRVHHLSHSTPGYTVTCSQLSSLKPNAFLRLILQPQNFTI